MWKSLKALGRRRKKEEGEQASQGGTINMCHIHMATTRWTRQTVPTGNTGHMPSSADHRFELLLITALLECFP